MKRRLICLLLVFALFSSLIPMKVGAISGVIPGIQYDMEDQTVTATASDGKLIACSYDKGTGRMLDTVLYPVNGWTRIHTNYLHTGDKNIKLFLTDHNSCPLTKCLPVDDAHSSSKNQTCATLTDETSTLLTEQAVIETGGAFPEGTTLTVVETTVPGTQVLPESSAPIPVPAPAPDPEDNSPDEVPVDPDLEPKFQVSYTMLRSMSITAADGNGNELKPADTAGNPEPVCIRMDLSQQNENLIDLCPMYFDESTNRWVMAENYYLDEANKELVILTNHFSKWGLFLRKQTQAETASRRETFTWRDLDSSWMASMPSAMAAEMLKAYEKQGQNTDWSCIRDAFVSLEKVTSSQSFSHFCTLMDKLGSLENNLSQCDQLKAFNAGLSKVGIIGSGLSLAKAISDNGFQSPDAAMSAATGTLGLLATKFALLGPAVIAVGVAQYAIDTVRNNVSELRNDNITRLHTAYYKDKEFTGYEGGKRARDWRKELDPLYREDREAFPQVMRQRLDDYADKFWQDYGNEKFYLQLHDTIQSNKLWGGKVPNLTPNEKVRYAATFKKDLLDPLEPLVNSYIRRLNSDAQFEYYQVCSKELARMNRLIGIKLTEDAAIVDGKRVFATEGGYAVFHGADKAIWSQPFKTSGDQSVCLLDFRMKSYLDLPDESKYKLDIFDRNDKLLRSYDLKKYGGYDPAPGKLNHISLYGLEPSITYNFRENCKDGVSLLAGMYCALLDSQGIPRECFQLDANGRASITMNKQLYEQRELKKFVLYGSAVDMVNCTNPIQTILLPGFTNHTFSLESVGNYTIRIESSNPKKSTYKGCTALLYSGAVPLTAEFAKTYSTKLDNNGCGTITIPVETFHLMGNPILQLCDGSIRPETLVGVKKVPKSKGIHHVPAEYKPGTILIILPDTTPAGSFLFDDPDFEGSLNIEKGESVNIRCKLIGEGRLEATSSDSCVFASANGTNVHIQGNQGGYSVVTVSYGNDSATIPVYVREDPNWNCFDGLFLLQHSYNEQTTNYGFSTFDKSHEKPQYIGLLCYPANGSDIQKIELYAADSPNLWGDKRMEFTREGSIFVSGDDPKNRTELTLGGEYRTIFTGGNPDGMDYVHVVAYSRFYCLAPWHQHNMTELKDLYQQYSQNIIVPPTPIPPEPAPENN